MRRTGWLAVVALGAVALGAAVRWTRPSPQAALPCPSEDVRWFDAGTAQVARCAPGAPPAAGPAAQALVVGQKLDLNQATEAELAVLPGVGPSLARAIVQARARQPFQSWEDVDRVPGVGPSKLVLLKGSARLGIGGQ